MNNWLRKVLLLVVCFCSAFSFAEERSSQTQFVMGNFEFALLHELAHVVIGDNDVPVLGPLESTADYVAIVMAIRGDGSDSAQTFLSQAIMDSAEAFETAWKSAQSRFLEIPYWDSHALSIQRYYAAICLLFGSDPDSRDRLLMRLPEGRARGCVAEFEAADAGFQWLVNEYSSKSAQTPLIPVEFDYGPVSSKQQRTFVAEIRSLGLLENTVNDVFALFPPSAAISVSMRTCGRPEAAWQPEKRELVFCYELLDTFASIHKASKRLNRR